MAAQRVLHAFLAAVTLLIAVSQLVNAESPVVQSLYNGVDQMVQETSNPNGDNIFDIQNVTLSVAVSFNVPGKVIGVRYLKKSQVGSTGGDRQGLLYDKDGVILAQGEFADTADFGWQYLTFDTPVSIVVGEVYYAAYWTDSGYAYQYSVPASVGNIIVEPQPGFFIYGSFPTGKPTDNINLNYFADVSFVADAPASGCTVDCELASKPIVDGEATATTQVLSISCAVCISRLFAPFECDVISLVWLAGSMLEPDAGRLDGVARLVIQ